MSGIDTRRLFSASRTRSQQRLPGLVGRARALTRLKTAAVVSVAVLSGLATGYAAQSFVGPPSALNTNAGTDSGDDYSPQVTTDGAGNWVAVWRSDEDSLGDTIGTDTDILVARSTDNGVSWTAPAALNTNADTDSGDDRSPQVTTDGAGNWVAVWHSWDSLGDTIGTDRDILVAGSTDNGASWTAPAALNSNASTDSGWDDAPQVTTDGTGNWVAAWRVYDYPGGTIGYGNILVARSTDNGATWTAPAPLNTNTGTDSGGNWSPEVTTDGAGSWVAVWYSYDDLGGTIGTDADILVARSTDNGATWTATAALNTNAVTDSGGDAWPQVTTDAAGNWVAVWYSYNELKAAIGTDSDILLARSTDNGASWTAPAALNTNAGTDSGDDRYPQVTIDGAGGWVAVWSSSDDLGGTIDTDWDALVARSTDNGATWTVPAALNTNAGKDSKSDFLPQVTTDGAGNWVAVWYSYDRLRGTIGDDADVLVAFAAQPPPGKDHFKCYRATDLRNPKFVPTTVGLSDQFSNDGSFEVKKPFLVCNPTDKNGEGINNETDHLTCYKITGPRLDKNDQPHVQVTDQFATLRLKVKKPFLLCVPSAKTVLP